VSPLIKVGVRVHQGLHFLRPQALDHFLELLRLVVVVVLVVGTLEKPGINVFLRFFIVTDERAE
jgi:hypothetical protein